jgi:hypothetical protein
VSGISLIKRAPAHLTFSADCPLRPFKAWKGWCLFFQRKVLNLLPNLRSFPSNIPKPS